MKVLAIDPGTTESGYCMLDGYKPVPALFGKLPNDLLLQTISTPPNYSGVERVVIEMVESYGNAVGQTVFETCVWIGRFMEAARQRGFNTDRIFRTEEKLMICHSRKAKDTNIRTALIDRFADHDKERGKGTKANPDWFYGFANDAWMAYAVGVTWLDKQQEEIINR
ncbi:MAG: hypothetical protein IKP40_13550 [Clostridia bacterium]|nr:hypothetical protein [Clostridia bacterium]